MAKNVEQKLPILKTEHSSENHASRDKKSSSFPGLSPNPNYKHQALTHLAMSHC